MILLYIDAVFAVLLGGLSSLLAVLLIAGGVLGALGIANELRWGYNLAVVVTGIRVAFLAWIALRLGPGVVLDPNFLFAALIPIAMFVLVIHPMSREYQRIWFH